MDYKNKIDFLLGKVKFRLTAGERVRFERDLKNFKDSLLIFDEFDLKDIEPMRTPFENIYGSLREDILEDSSKSKENEKLIFKNASSIKDGYIFLEKDNK